MLKPTLSYPKYFFTVCLVFLISSISLASSSDELEELEQGEHPRQSLLSREQQQILTTELSKSQILTDEQKKLSYRKSRKAYFKALKKRRELYHKQNTIRYGKRYKFAVGIAKAAAQLMEKPFDQNKSFDIGLSCLESLKNNRYNEQKLEDTLFQCQSFLREYKDRFQYHKIPYVNRLKPDRQVQKAKLFARISMVFQDNIELVKYLERSVVPYMVCTSHGGSLGLAYIFGGSVGMHTYVCESQLGRRKLYASYKLHVGMGVGAYLTANMQEYEYYEGDYYNTEAIVLSYSNIEDQRSHASMSFGGGLGIGVSAQIVDKDIEVPEVGIGAGGLYGMGYGSMFHIKHLTPNFEKLFTLLDLGFDPTY